MSEILVSQKVYDNEAPTTEGRLADLIQDAEIRVDGYRLSDEDRSRVVAALRAAAP